MKHWKIPFDTGIGQRLVGLALYALALITSSMGFLLDSPTLVTPSLFIGGAVLLAAVWYHVTAAEEPRRSQHVVPAPVRSEVVLKRAS